MEFTLPKVLRDLRVQSDAAVHLRDYYHSAARGSIPTYSGSRFEAFPTAEAPATPPNEITAEDLLAVQCLGVGFSGDQELWILDVKRADITKLLCRIPLDWTLWGDPDVVGSHQIRELWELLRSVKGVGPTRASKLMARKRPNLCPIFDSRVRAALGAHNSVRWYEHYRDLMRTEDDRGHELHERIGQLIGRLSEEEDSGVPQNLAVLRACDVILWMEQKKSGKVASA